MVSAQECSQPIALRAYLCLACFLLSGVASATPSITLSKKSGPPTSKILVSGSGFEANVGVDIFFDTKDRALVVTNGKGAFHDAGIYAPRGAHPGKHWVTALERNNDKGAQEPFLVQTDWSQFHFDADGTRFNPYENVLNRRVIENMGLKWTFGTNGDVGSSDAVANGVAYIAADTHVYALDANTGSKLWSYDTGFGLQSSPAVANDVVYIGSTAADFYALNASTGALLWQYSPAGSSSAAVANGVVYVGADYNVSALDATTGALLWTYATNGVVYSAPAVVNGIVYIGGGSSLYAVDARSGAQLWVYATGNAVESSPAVASGVVYVGSWDGSLYALNSSTGTKLWSYATGNPVSSSPAVANGVVYVGSDDNHVYAVDASTGVLLWRFAANLSVVSSPAVANGLVYVDSYDGNLYALDSRTGVPLWTYTIGGVLGSSATVVNGTVYIGVYAFGPTRGNQAKQGGTARRPDLKTLSPDFNLKRSKLDITVLRH